MCFVVNVKDCFSTYQKFESMFKASEFLKNYVQNSNCVTIWNQNKKIIFNNVAPSTKIFVNSSIQTSSYCFTKKRIFEYSVFKIVGLFDLEFSRSKLTRRYVTLTSIFNLPGRIPLARELWKRSCDDHLHDKKRIAGNLSAPVAEFSSFLSMTSITYSLMTIPSI